MPAHITIAYVGALIIVIVALAPPRRADPVIMDIHSGVHAFGGIELTEGKGFIGGRHRLEIDSVNAFYGANDKGIMAQEV